VPYPDALAQMDERAAAIVTGQAGELVWLLEHPPLYTSGTSAQPTDLLDSRFPVFRSRTRAGNSPITGPDSAWLT